MSDTTSFHLTYIEIVISPIISLIDLVIVKLVRTKLCFRLLDEKKRAV